MSKIAICGDVHIQEKNPRCRSDNYLETVLNKLEFIAKNNDYVIILGDVFNHCSNSTLLYNKVLLFFLNYPNKFIAIPGNHDTFHRSLKDLNRTTIGSLWYTHAINLKTEPFELEGVKFSVSLVDKNLSNIPIDTDNENILLGHNYYEMDLCPEESLTRQDIVKLNYRYVLLGHDHKPYEEDFIGNSMLIRMGSLTRVDTQQYNFSRKIYYYQYDTEQEEMVKKEVPHLPVEQIYIENAFHRKIEKQEVSFAQLADEIKKFKAVNKGNLSLHNTLVKICTPQDYMDKIKYLHDITGTTYS